MTEKIVGYIEGADRNNPNAVRSHLYAQDTSGQLWPMCGYGWNRSDGNRLSILRGNSSARGKCALCQRNRAQDKEPIWNGFDHKTKWL